MTGRRYWIGVGLGFVAALITAFASTYALGVFGAYTGAFGICGTGAPDWWIDSYHIAFCILVPTIPTVVGLLTFRLYRRAATRVI